MGTVIRHTVNIDRAPNHLASSGILNTREKREEIEFDFIRVVKVPAKRFADGGYNRQVVGGGDFWTVWLLRSHLVTLGLCCLSP